VVRGRHGVGPNRSVDQRAPGPDRAGRSAAGLIQFIAEDSYGDLWGTTAGSGIFRLEDSGIRAYYGPDGLGGPRDGARISSIFEDRKGRLCVLTGWDEGSLRVFTNNAFKLVAIPYPKDFAAYGWGSRQFGFQAHDGEWWLPSGGGLLRFTAGDSDDLPRAKLKALYDDRSGLHCLDVARAFEDSAGDVWVACMYPAVSFVRWSRQSDEFHTFGPAENWDTSGIVTLIREPHPGEFGRSQRKVFRVFITAVSNRSQGPETCHSPVIPGRTWE